MPDENSVIIEAWNTVLFDKFRRFKHLLVDGLSRHSDTFFGREPFHPGARILDVGCGFGDTTVHLAKTLGGGTLVVGVDCAENFVREGEELAAQAGTSNARFLVADVQTADLQGPYDYAFGRFGTMFFSMPSVAMVNIRRHLKPGGQLSMIVWRKREDNPWLHDAELAVREIVPVVAHEETDAVHCGPGPFSMCGADMVSSMLLGVGYERISFERNDADICIGCDLEDAVAFAMSLGPAGEIIRLAGEEGEKRRDQVTDALHKVLTPYVRADGVWAPSSTWFVRAYNPA